MARVVCSCGYEAAYSADYVRHRLESCIDRPSRQTADEHREQRRYEIARDVMAATAPESAMSWTLIATGAVIAADALLAELERTETRGE